MKILQIPLLFCLLIIVSCASDDEEPTPTSELNFTEQPVTASAEFSARNRHTSVVFDDKIWVIGGNHSTYKNRWENKMDDVWYSSDGAAWTLATNNAPFSERINHTSVVFDNKLWVIGGDDAVIADEWWHTNIKNDVWYSSDGIIWTEATAAAQFSARVDHTSVVFDNKIWIIGGYDNSYKNDVWYSSDGVTWTEATSEAAFSVRGRHSSIVFDNKIWVIGGLYSDLLGDDPTERKNDVWYSSDGVNWTEATNDAPFSKREGHTTVVYDDKLWVIGGTSYTNNEVNTQSDRKNDIWYSSDGITWTEATNGLVPFTGRYNHSSVIFDDKVWIIGGYDGENKNDVWAFD